MSYNPQLVSIHDFREEDIPGLLRYWYHSPPGFIEGIGADPNKLPSEETFAEGIRARCRKNAESPEFKMNAVAILYDGQVIGTHVINPLTEGEEGIFHAHIWEPSMRRKGIGMISYPLACQLFMERFHLKRILFKTPKQNTGSIRVKEKLGIREIGEEEIGFGIIKEGTVARVFELTRDEAARLLLRVRTSRADAR